MKKNFIIKKIFLKLKKISIFTCVDGTTNNNPSVILHSNRGGGYKP